MKITEEFQEKTDRVRSLLQREALAGMLFKRQANFSWITCGGHDNVSMASDIASASVLVTPSRAVLICSNIERERLLAEEINGLTDLIEVEDYAWNEKTDFEVANAIMSGKKWGSDVPCRSARTVLGQIAEVRSPLHANEVDRYKKLGKDVGAILMQTAKGLKPGVTEFAVAGRIAEQCLAQGITPGVVLVAADDRIKKFRHPVATATKIKKRAMMVLNVKRDGLYAAASRIVCLKKPTVALVKIHAACCRIEAAAMAATRPDNTLGKVFKAIIAAYEEEDFPEEWRLHHQGGPIGYDGRDLILTSQSLKTPVLEDQAFAFNPSITGSKSEDTFIAKPKGPTVVTAAPGWPMVKCETEMGVVERPDMLIL